MVYSTKYIPYRTRVKRPILVITIILVVAIPGIYFLGSGDFRLFILAGIVTFAIIIVLVTIENARVFVNQVEIADDKIMVGGYHYNTRWRNELNIANSEIKITLMKGRWWTMTCCLKIISPGQSADLDALSGWDATTLSTILREFRQVKGEQITAEEDVFLTKMVVTDG